MGTITFYFYLLKNGEINTVIYQATGLNGVGIARFLAAKLVTGKTQHYQALVAKFFVELLKTGILWREPAFAGGVHNENNLVPVLGKIDGLSSKGIGSETVEITHNHILVDNGLVGGTGQIMYVSESWKETDSRRKEALDAIKSHATHHTLMMVVMQENSTEEALSAPEFGP